MAPTTMETVARLSAEYKPAFQRFVLQHKTFDQQFSHMYVSRLRQLRDAVALRVEGDAEAADVAVLSKIIDLREGDAECVVVGTLLKVLGGKPDVFEALVSERGLEPIEQAAAPLATADDALILEDESGRVELEGDISTAQLVTGVVLGVRGRMDASSGAFRVSRVFLPGLAPQPPLPARGESAYVALVSGLALGAAAGSSASLRSHLLVDYLAGRIGDAAERQFVARIVRTIVAGDAVACPGMSAVAAASAEEDGFKQKKADAAQLEAQAAALKEADELLSTLASSMAVDLMPGARDPSNYALPQQSLHPCLLPRSARFSSFRSVPNPYEAHVGGVRFAGHSGQPLASVLQSSLPQTDDAMDGSGDRAPGDGDRAPGDGDRALDALQRCLEWRHLAPTAPDLLACVPVAGDDPFVLEASPHVLFAGNQPRFATREVTSPAGQRVRVVTVPAFDASGVVVLVDLKDLSCFPVTLA